MKKIVVVDKREHSLARIYFIADVKKYQVLTQNDFTLASATLSHEMPDVLLVNCDLYKGDFTEFIRAVRALSQDIRIIGFSWKVSETFRRSGSPFALDAFIKMPMDVRKLSLALEAIECNYMLFPSDIMANRSAAQHGASL
ncbi:response regulator transcription factor [Rahnella woolbedingensis]|uniref:DNA-binding response regulator n=1 Tax=Rahnella woolbedingensis TaxID=1510574 RepID=A0A419N7R8_9GAMM|nr:response regulator transcription factor [Rahnella woolbedingensis]RJT43416.1 DNA-binding response regulator [Rahnella woolbedingensis]